MLSAQDQQHHLVHRSEYALNGSRAGLAHERKEVGADVTWSHLCMRAGSKAVKKRHPTAM